MLYTVGMKRTYHPISLAEAVAAFPTKAALGRALGVTRYTVNTYCVRGELPSKHSLFLAMYHQDLFTKDGKARKRTRNA